MPRIHRLIPCKVCGAHDFYLASRDNGKKHETCVPCKRRSDKKWRNANKAKVKAYDAKYYRERALDPEYEKQRRYSYKRANTAEYLFSLAKNRAKRKGWVFTLSSPLPIPRVCPVLGIELAVCCGDKWRSPSYDRIDSTKGYIEGNVIVVSYRANILKNNATPEELSLLAEFYCRLLPKRKAA